MDPVWIFVAFVLGFAVKQIGLPPLVGFLLAGFVLNAMGVESTEALEKVADFGILLLLFSIGLKLNIKSLLKTEIWATASLHLLIGILVFGLGIFGLSFLGSSMFGSLDFRASLLIAFALSFSSTVFAVKILEEKGNMSSAHGRIAIGILIMQDIFAVIFLTFSSGKFPSPWALGLLALVFVPTLLKKSFLSKLITKSGHGELLVLLGVLLPFGGAYLFSSVGLKPDLGALVMGILLAGHPKAKELSNSMLSFKDVFLVGFFLTIGLTGMPSFEAWGIALLFILVLPLKTVLFYLLMVRFRLRARTAVFTSFNLTNYSEFGLIVGAAGVSSGWISSEWVVIFALALSLSFVLASPLNMTAQAFYLRWQKLLMPFESEKHLPEDEPIAVGNAEIIILGMGRTGTEIYKNLKSQYNSNIMGVDNNKACIERHLEANRNVVFGDITNMDFFQRLKPSDTLRLIIITTSQHKTQMDIIKQIGHNHRGIEFAALSRFPDEMDKLREAGVEVVFDLYSEAGIGFANHISQKLQLEHMPHN